MNKNLLFATLIIITSTTIPSSILKKIKDWSSPKAYIDPNDFYPTQEEIESYQSESSEQDMSKAIHAIQTSKLINRIDQLLKSGTKITNLYFDEEETLFRALFYYEGLFQVAEHLLLHGYPIDQQDQNKETALFDAVRTLNINAVKYLISRGANVNARNSFLMTPIFNLTMTQATEPRRKHHIFTINDALTPEELKMYTRGIKPSRDPYQEYLKSLSNQKASEHSYRALFKKYLRTTMWEEKRQIAMASYLIKRGANVNALNKFGETVLDYAIIDKNFALANYLTLQGAKRGSKIEDSEITTLIQSLSSAIG